MYVSNNVKIINNTKEKDTFFCVQCNFPLKSFEDFNYHKEWSACHSCFLQFVEARKNEWSKGWRPTKERLVSYLKERKQF